MKNIGVVLLSMVIGCISTGSGCSKKEKDYLSEEKDYPSEETLIDIYYENKELINSIKDGFFSSGYIPPHGSSIFLHYDYNNRQLFCSDDARGEKIQSIQNIHSYAIEFFTRINKNYACISFRNTKQTDVDDITIVFSFGSSVTYVAYILYTNTPEIWPWTELVHIEDNWYIQRYIFRE